mmetsp:Transcript_23858/g.64181  ORF Transcript_23858/g.64181 Transcript_23858/m.64181 type:complete len:202 (+) Transcript_23858:138-743(+)
MATATWLIIMPTTRPRRTRQGEGNRSRRRTMKTLRTCRHPASGSQTHIVRRNLKKNHPKNLHGGSVLNSGFEPAGPLPCSSASFSSSQAGTPTWCCSSSPSRSACSRRSSASSATGRRTSASPTSAASTGGSSASPSTSSTAGCCSCTSRWCTWSTTSSAGCRTTTTSRGLWRGCWASAPSSSRWRRARTSTSSPSSGGRT